MDTIGWVDDVIELIDQTALPGRLTTLRVTSTTALVHAIQRLAVRGAPALGVAGAYGVALAVRTEPAVELMAAIDRLRQARPTAVNLARMVDRVAAHIPDGPGAVLQAAHEVREEEVQASIAMGELGADLVSSLVERRPLRLMTICNTGGLAAVSRGTALAVVQTLHERGIVEDVLALETRPLLQGGRLTTWELRQMGAPHHLLVDGAAASTLARGLADAVLVGADRIAANGDVANKIGTLGAALGAAHAGVPFIVVAPESTIDTDTPDGRGIEIEDRGATEVVEVAGHLMAPAGTPAINPAFDVTPASLIRAIVTDRRVIDTAGGQLP